MSDLENARSEIAKLIKDSYKRGGVDVCDALIAALNALTATGIQIEMPLSDFVEVVEKLKKRVEE